MYGMFNALHEKGGCLTPLVHFDLINKIEHASFFSKCTPEGDSKTVIHRLHFRFPSQPQL